MARAAWGAARWSHENLWCWHSLVALAAAWVCGYGFANATVALVLAVLAYTIVQIVSVRAGEGDPRRRPTLGQGLKGRSVLGWYLVAIALAGRWFIPQRRVAPYPREVQHVEEDAARRNGATYGE